MSSRGGWQRWRAMTRASTHKPALRCSAIDQPTISRVARSLMAARYRKPSSVGIYERYCRRIRWTWLGGLGPWAKAGWQSGMRAASNRIVPLRASTAVPSRAARRIRRQYLTYIPIGRGFLYLVAIIDWASRAVLP